MFSLLSFHLLLAVYGGIFVLQSQFQPSSCSLAMCRGGEDCEEGGGEDCEEGGDMVSPGPSFCVSCFVYLDYGVSVACPLLLI